MLSITVWEHDSGARLMGWSHLEGLDGAGYHALGKFEVPDDSSIGEEDGDSPKFSGYGTHLWHRDFEFGVCVYGLEDAGLFTGDNDDLSPSM